MRRSVRVIGGVVALVASYKLGQCSAHYHYDRDGYWAMRRDTCFVKHRQMANENTAQLNNEKSGVQVNETKSSELLES